MKLGTSFNCIGVALIWACTSCNSVTGAHSSSLLEQHSKSMDPQEPRTTLSGYVFARDTSNPKLGEAWRDPLGMIWGDIVLKADGSHARFNLKDATEYCKNIGAQIPTVDDFGRLSDYLGRLVPGATAGYKPQILPNLTQTFEGESGPFTMGIRYLTSTLTGVYWSYQFDGLDGYDYINSYYPERTSKLRCAVSSVMGKTFKERGPATGTLTFNDTTHFQRVSQAYNRWSGGAYTINNKVIKLSSDDGSLKETYTLSDDSSLLFYGSSDIVGYTLVK
ncbi:MAG: hypothetical protein NTV34_02525 [Proteobacteria bacterium]|nr:hypothetical protein [Pseudomonadota bacterium]